MLEEITKELPTCSKFHNCIGLTLKKVYIAFIFTNVNFFLFSKIVKFSKISSKGIQQNNHTFEIQTFPEQTLITTSFLSASHSLSLEWPFFLSIQRLLHHLRCLVFRASKNSFWYSECVKKNSLEEERIHMYIYLCLPSYHSCKKIDHA